MTCAKFALGTLIIALPLQIMIGDQVGRNVYKYQPIKTAAIEGVWHTQAGAPLLLFAYPDMSLEKNLWPVGIPKLAALINTHHWNGVLEGLTNGLKRIVHSCLSCSILLELWLG